MHGFGTEQKGKIQDLPVEDHCGALVMYRENATVENGVDNQCAIIALLFRVGADTTGRSEARKAIEASLQDYLACIRFHSYPYIFHPQSEQHV